MRLLFLVLGLTIATSSCYSSRNNDSEKGIMVEVDIFKLINKGDLLGVEQAIKGGMNVNTIDNNKQSLLLIATQNNDLDMVKLLLKYRADVNQQSNNLDSPFLTAGANGQTEFIKLFLDNGARFDVFNRYNGTALIPACERGHIETVKLLASTKDFPINHINRLGWTALMEAVILGDGSDKYQKIVQILKDAGAHMDIPDRDGVTPLKHAQRLGYKEIVSILK